jgi:hypothetical protein
VQVVCCECKLAPHDCAPHDQAEAAPKSGSAADTISILIFDASTARVWSGNYFASAQIDQQPCCGIALGEKQTHGEGPIIRGNFRARTDFLPTVCLRAHFHSLRPSIEVYIEWVNIQGRYFRTCLQTKCQTSTFFRCDFLSTRVRPLRPQEL